MQASKEKKLMASKCIDEAFTTRGLVVTGKVAFTKHEQSRCHKEAVDAVITVPSSYKDCAEILSSQHAKDKANNRQMLYKILSSV